MKFGTLLNCLKDVKELGVSGFLRPNVTVRAKLKDTVKLVAKGFTLIDDVDYKETFSLDSKKNSFRIIMTLVAQYDLELYQMDVEITFMNGNLEEEVYMDQPGGFEIKGKEHTMCKLKKLIYGIKQAS